MPARRLPTGHVAYTVRHGIPPRWVAFHPATMGSEASAVATAHGETEAEALRALAGILAMPPPTEPLDSVKRRRR